ncbi:UDP-4-amino-4,6-dideoxy-N-acetyl-beta-L-altrosamine transaminase [Parageobacillus thermoglucosidasius]|uniref:UDP-4-amino-4, 6-dideoxy-N-acetyl-beta-L-altrosamine transaminase n=1 Tax=Parageobacillus thermoglucosidasius TaxID=1426 RepID=UPI002E23275F|nr:UDP-4-amino-4,6-dideoxy-N-acetyl-beta-L-altrosamine transaminase [Parageobacillus thermoglucosidasius]MED4905496.1 UDP-4-amino-4,6-dideoxy-N-acetyl-beta-L-altrosamine transaminase [Parageobacillus thermoglucosidasius]MED4913895.1 UDP-4-amino-4,6-dideoxy-N-acetyl-beta-L-altrosamine transaminase [Parageobacillus thermoglucosidasius]MED4943874.1 UDP-4-amino-4,6-dideoxy-N-acetyl-beta-L-altrosamine transaminase [Parageobacillus thermoglucosidasius]MED4983608.1 UDP-4-amino-4,6-dideoxy-N-acetyl-bet
MKKRESFLSYGQQWITDEDIEAVVDVLKSPFLTQGPKIHEFERKVADYVGAKYAVAFSNGTAALHGACFAAGIGEGDEVITTPITFAATSNAVLYCGGKPVFADIDDRTYNIDPKEIRKHITPNTKAIIAVDFTGQPADMDAIMEIANEHGLIVIEDGAHSLGAEYKGRKVGTLAHMTMFSFHPVKPVTTAEGGVIVTDSEEYYEKLKRFRSHGIIKHNLSRDEGPWYYEMVDLGYNYRMTDLQAALGISQMDKLDCFIERRREIASMYNEAFKTMDSVILPMQLERTQSGWHLYVLQLKLDKLKRSRREIFESLRAENIGVHVHYIPVYWHPYYQKLGYRKGICPKAERWYEQALTLPIFPKMTNEDVSDVIEAVKRNVY